MTSFDFKQDDVPPLSEAEVLAMLQAAGITAANSPIPIEIYKEYIRGAFADLVVPMTQETYDALLSVIQRNPPQAVLDAIRARAISNARDLITQMTQTELVKVHAELVAGTAAGKGPLDVARKLDSVKGLDAPRAATYEKYVEELRQSGLTDAEIDRRAKAMYDKLLRDRKETIARTEMRKATSQVRYEEAKATGAKMQVWQTVGDARVSDQCQACEAQGPIPFGENFTSGNATPPNHPRCRCAVSYYSNTALNDVYKRRADAAAARTAAAKGDNEE